MRLYRDLVEAAAQPRRFHARPAAATARRVIHVNDSNKVIAFHRWDKGGPGDDVIVVLNFSNQLLDNYRIGFPTGGLWKLRLNTDWEGYSKDFTNHSGGDVTADGEAWSNYPTSATVNLAAYSALIYTQDVPPPVPEPAAVPKSEAKKSRASDKKAFR